MPISDLLAQITGSTTPPPPAVPLKRRADDDFKGPVAKKTITATSSVTANSNGLKRPAVTSQNASASRPTALPPSNGASGTPSSVRKPSVTPAKPVTRPPPASNNSRPLASPTVRQAPTNATPKAPPKKGSYAEIMARAAAAKATMGTVGQIQHKPLEKILGKQKQDPKAELDPRASKKGVLPSRAGYKGTLQSNAPSTAAVGRSGARDTKLGGGNTKALDAKKPVNGKGGKPAVVEEKRVKKAALATTGYQGTASARPDTGKKGAPSGSASRGGSDRVPFGGRRRPREEEELDDFIEYDDEEEEEEAERYQRRYHYQSEDDESDMEAGLSDLDEEERRAERLARQEDQREQEILDRHQREKLEKKRLFAARAAARR